MGVPVLPGGAEIARFAGGGGGNGKILPVGGNRVAALAGVLTADPFAAGPAPNWPATCNDSRMNIAALSTPAAAATLSPGIFLDPLAVGIVLGGTAATVLLRNQLRDVGRALAALRTLWRRPFDAAPLLHQAAALERIAKRHGLLSLDRSVLDDPDMADAVHAAVDGATPDQVGALVSARIDSRADRHRAAIEVWTGAAETAPAMGLIGTILGLVQMFAAMTDPDRIGAAMAVALLATLYGALLANLVAMPIASRLKRLARTEAAERQRLIAPLAALARLERARKRDIAA
jgi:chemotaxis protein MotA